MSQEKYKNQIELIFILFFTLFIAFILYLKKLHRSLFFKKSYQNNEDYYMVKEEKSKYKICITKLAFIIPKNDFIYKKSRIIRKINFIFILTSFYLKLLIFLFIIIYIIIIILKINYITKDIPKISIFLPIYNKNKYLLKCIRSIQNQTLKEIEIIAINDYSNDNSLQILKSISKIDTRLKIVNNDRNHGLLYSRSMGILNSTGEFLMNLDPDDQIYKNNNLETLYKIAKNYKVDILNFAYIFKNKIDLKCNIKNKIIKRPKLFNSAFNRYNDLKDYLIWNKLIKRKIMLMSFELFKTKIFSQKWNYHEDNIWSILIYKNANSMMCINKTIYKHNALGDSLMRNIQGSYLEIKNLIYCEEILRIILKNKNNIKFLLGQYYKLIYRIKTKIHILKLNFDIKGKLIKILNLCIHLYKCSDFIINNIRHFINIININQFIYRHNIL